MLLETLKMRFRWILNRCMAMLIIKIFSKVNHQNLSAVIKMNLNNKDRI